MSAEAGVYSLAQVCTKERTSRRRLECCEDFLSLRKWFKGAGKPTSGCYSDTLLYSPLR